MFDRENRHRKITRTSSQPSAEKLEIIVRQRTAALHRLSARLLRVQEEERRRLSRELHDSTGQTLTALKIQAAKLESSLGDKDRALQAIAEINSAADQALQEIRTASYLLYPPLLDESGFVPAAQWYVEGLTKRSNLQVRLYLAPASRLPRVAETALFRVLQESLTNVYRHSASQVADVRLRVDAELITLEVRDYGKGISSERLEQFNRTGCGVGVGLAGMRERIEDLSGRLEIISDQTGTLVRAVLPKADRIAVPSKTNLCLSAAA